MELNEAKKILNENGYELLEEGKLSRALGIGALALGSLFGNSHALEQQYNFRKADLTTIEFNDILNTQLKNNENVSYIKTNDKCGIIKFNNGDLKFVPYNHINGISDKITEITFELNSNHKFVEIIYEDGSAIFINADKNNSYYTEYDEYDTIITKDKISANIAIKLINQYYELVK